MSDVKVNRTLLEKLKAKLIAFLNGFGLLLDSQKSGMFAFLTSALLQLLT